VQRVDVSVRAEPELESTPLTFEEFFDEAWPWAFRLATMFTQDRSAGEEIAQDVLAGMYRQWGTADRPDAYLRTSLVNASSNWHRNSRTRRAKLPLLAVPDQVDFVARELTDAIALLPFRQRAVIVLRYYCDLSEAEIAEALNCRPGTVKSLASRALIHLQERIPR